ncbi:MAG: hypothetical protein K2L97_03090 [Muribaculaceae bacterium]|nr:hypothetical protein [Muribaculaceae bacterium]
MKKTIYLPLLAIGAMAALTGCDENSWNDKLDGFDASFNPTEVKSIELTLTDADYAAIASNKVNKEIAEKNDAAQALAALSGNKYFTDKITAAEYVPAFLSSTAPYMMYTDGSSIRLTYNVSVGLPAEVTESAGAWNLSVGEDFYKDKVWESDDNYIVGFAPEKPASRYLPAAIQESVGNLAQEGQYAIISYYESEQNPIFGNVGGGDEPDPGFTLSSVISEILAGDDVVIDGVVGGACTCGFVLTDLSGTIFVYMGSGFDPATYPIGTQLHLEGTATSYKNNLQIAVGATIDVKGTQAYTFPTPTVYDGAALDAVLSRPADQLAVFGKINGKVIVSGNNINIQVAGAETAMGSIYYPTDDQRAELTDGRDINLYGWFVSISGSRYCNFIINSLESATNNAPIMRSVAAPVVTVEKNAVYYYNGSKWVVPDNFVVLNPGDYIEMGLSYISAPDSYLPIYLKQHYPYAQPDNVKYVLYNSGSNGYACAEYIYDGGKWNRFLGIETETSQFVKAEGKWMFDPNVTITLPYGKGQTASAPFYQACVDWVYENKCVPLGDTSIKSGKFWVTSYGNNDYYCGTSAYQNNVDLRAASARAQYSAGWEGYTDEEIVATMEERCDREVFPAVLSEFYPDAKPIEGLEVIYTINFYAYALLPSGSYKTLPCVARYVVTAQGQFTYLDSEWLIGQ